MHPLRAVAVLIPIAMYNVRGQASPLVPLEARVYRDIDRLTAAGLIDTIIVGARPYTAREVARLLSEAKRNLGRLRAGTEWEDEVIVADLAVYGPHGNRPIDDARAGAAMMSSANRAVPTDANGSLAATINPLAAYQNGRPLVDGATATLETEHSAIAGPHFAATFNPRFTGERLPGDSSPALFRVQSASLSALFGNFRVDVGRASVLFGQAPTGGLLLSENAPPLDVIRVSNDRPGTLPWLFRRLGPVQGTLFVADLGTTDQVYPHAKLIGYHMSMLPSTRVELGVELLDETGGDGAPGASFFQRVDDAVPIVDVLLHQNFQFSNKMAGVDTRLLWPELAGLTMYGEVVVDDFDARRLRSSLLEDGGYIGGVFFACLAECGRVGVRAEYHQTGIRFYTHTQFSSGIEQNGIILGDPLGPRGLGEYVTIDREGDAVGTLSVSEAYEIRSGNEYGSVQDSLGGNFRFVQTVRRPGERRARALVSWRSGPPGARLSIGASAGVERVTDFAFVSGQNRTNGLVQVQVELRR